jgi:6-pyruvoyltetrahydropterin/6-carboxytetrahydropterin synthase
MHTITRTHEIHCGHRVVGHEGKCKQLHGHAYVFHLTATADGLDRVGRVIDFSVVKSTLCQWLEENWDHRCLINDKDPWLSPLLEIDPTIVPVPFNPTAENIAQHVVDVIAPRLFQGKGVRLISCRVDETSKCSATYAVSGQ